MGWSCSQRASLVFDAWTEFCLRQTDQQNVFIANRKKYFFERSNVEHYDGAITGNIWKFVENDRVRRSGNFRIDGDGIVVKAPTALKEVSPSQNELEATLRRY